MNNPKDNTYIDNEERELIESFERREWEPIENSEVKKLMLQRYAQYTKDQILKKSSS
jgi:hypothetical protein